jgi:hypothetical protein
MSLYNLPKEMLVKLIATIQENYKVENMEVDELKLLRTNINREITRRCLLDINELKKYSSIVLSLEKFSIFKYMIEFEIDNFIISIFPYTETVYIFSEANCIYFYFDDVNEKIFFNYDFSEIFDFSKKISPLRERILTFLL